MSANIADALGRPFDPAEVKWKPQSVKGDKALVIAYVDARVVMDRLDAVLGLGGWSDEYRPAPDGKAVVCRLTCVIDGRPITHEDVGGESEQPDDGDRCKAAFSDALKRAAVKFGVGRYLYRLPQQWVDYDGQRRRMVGRPTLPAWAIPGQAAPAEALRPSNTGQAPRPSKAPAPAASGKAERMAEAIERAAAFERRLVEAGICQAGELHLWLVEMCGTDWPNAPIDDIKTACQEFAAAAKAQKAGVA